MEPEKHVTIDHPIKLGFAMAFGFWLFTAIVMPFVIMLCLAMSIGK
ncbi:unnamed protein product [marine sediment metagenome]|uniref:Uncharacterized protein n=1 Tax=marine sediment metagenome TaxID=412755 RepID=X1AGL1_9ZZZZ